MKNTMVYGLSTVSDKGQIAIPVVIRRELDLKKGDKLLIIKRSDNAGFTETGDCFGNRRRKDA